MRIISGKYKHRRLNPPAGLPVRPTTDYARESLFNILNTYWDLDGVSVLDVFAGTGTVGFEFASRGASSVTAVDVNERCVKFINQTAASFGALNVKAYRKDAFVFLKLAKTSYDFIFADPPFDMADIAEVHKYVFEHNLLKPGGWLIIEHSERIGLSACSHLFQHRIYGKVHFSIFANEDSDEKTT
ncbi:MAG: 16S rRNA (guanine(966)-N(2))-methyltransferase RsmD [Bacteroidetes bacterium]|nr:16S rRNA (guanine(966)-N(2))-methyltransferase RsmD [Bacteroidota bacterium]MBU1719013.1 16S rRNA (guanine(966)-N(2))-methyltransferase RsmD [Bacteroidota bacterium]